MAESLVFGISHKKQSLATQNWDIAGGAFIFSYFNSLTGWIQQDMPTSPFLWGFLLLSHKIRSLQPSSGGTT
ncbi:MAG: hypothetical protein IPP37_06070 [Saprospiraceae bacterium]|nr:hypothetical protein [Saprospiraceae bacterium]